LGAGVAPVSSGKPGDVCLTYEITSSSGTESGELKVGELRMFSVPENENADLSIKPARRWDAGAGQGQEVKTVVRGGESGIILDGRGRPILFVQSEEERVTQIAAWANALDLYPRENSFGR
ncbi:MAG: methylaspartate mutase, partial [bacterium]|nr:methylaspartate mutase [bacterium]